MSDTYQGQLWGGPGHGDLISSTVPRFRYEVTTEAFFDGGYEPPSRHTMAGGYIWNPEIGRYDWEGPGADGDTMERLRLQPRVAELEVWAVVYSNYEPAEVDSLWTTEARAQERAGTLEGEWVTVRWKVSE